VLVSERKQNMSFISIDVQTSNSSPGGREVGRELNFLAVEDLQSDKSYS
jgi:hypothetical protein